MEPVSGLSSIIEILRQQINNKSTRTGKKTRTSSTRDASPAKTQARPDIQQLERHISAQIQALDVDEEKRDLRAMQIFIGEVLAWEFGDEVVQDDRFPELLEEVCRIMSKEPRIKQQLDLLIEKFDGA